MLCAFQRCGHLVTFTDCDTCCHPITHSPVHCTCSLHLFTAPDHCTCSLHLFTACMHCVCPRRVLIVGVEVWSDGAGSYPSETNFTDVKSLVTVCLFCTLAYCAKHRMSISHCPASYYPGLVHPCDSRSHVHHCDYVSTCNSRCTQP